MTDVVNGLDRVVMARHATKGSLCGHQHAWHSRIYGQWELDESLINMGRCSFPHGWV